MKEKFKQFAQKNKAYIMGGVTTLALAVPQFAYAEGPSISATITTSFQQVVTDTLTSIAAIAPIGITVFAATYVWKYAKRFFTTVTK